MVEARPAAASVTRMQRQPFGTVRNVIFAVVNL
jgi:hypothetical protein